MPEELIGINKKVLDYISARQRYDQANAELVDKQKEVDHLAAKLRTAWEDCKDAPHGVYAFKEKGRVVVVVDGDPTPKLTVIR